MILATLGKHFPGRALEWAGGLMMLPWGIYVFTHPTLFTDPRISTVFEGLAQAAWFWPPHVSWGLFAVTVASIRLVALYVNGTRPVASPRIRLFASFLSAFVWTQVLVGMIKADVPNTGLVLYTGLICADIYSAARATRDVVLTSRERLFERAARGSHEQRHSRSIVAS